MSHVCPECRSTNTEKETILGAKTGDRICLDCGHVGPAHTFKEKS